MVKVVHLKNASVLGVLGVSVFLALALTVSVSAQTALSQFAVGDRVQTTAALNIRSSASTLGTLLGTQPRGSLGTVTAGPVSANGYAWWNVNYDAGVDGWAVGNYLVRYGTSSSGGTTTVSPTPPPAPRVTSVSPASGQPGTRVTVYGSGFSATDVVTFGSGIVQPEASSTPTRIIFTAPIVLIPKCNFENPPCSDAPYTPLSGTYPVGVTSDPTLPAANTLPFVFSSGPVITGIFPSSGRIGTQVTLTGRGFSSAGNAVNFDCTGGTGLVGIILCQVAKQGVIVQIGNSTSVVKFTIPAKVIPRCAVSLTPCTEQPYQPFPGTYAVSVAPNFDFNRASNKVTFNLLSGSSTIAGPIITGIDPPSGTMGTRVTITGNGFSPNFNVINFGSAVIVPQLVNNNLVFDIPTTLAPRCTIFGNPPCQVSLSSLPPVTPGIYNVSVSLDATKTSNATQFSVTSVPLPVSTPLLPKEDLIGAQVRATESVNVRSAASLSADVLGVVKAGTIGFVSEGPVTADGYDWVEVNWEGGLFGWSVQNYVARASVSPCPVAVGNRVTVNAGGQQAFILYVRSTPSLKSSIVGGELGGAVGTVASGPVIAESYNWWQVRFADGVTGWATDSNLFDSSCIVVTPGTVPTPPPAPPPPPPPPPPPAPMTVSFTNPTQGATVSGIVNVSVTVTSPSSPVTQVAFYKDNRYVSADTTVPYGFSFDASKETNGTHSLAAVAWNAARQSASRGIIVTVTGGISPAPPPVPLSKFAVGDRVVAQTSSNLGLNIRSGPSTGYSIIGTAPNGTLGTILKSPPTVADSYTWYQVKWDNGYTGWSAESFMEKAP